MTTVSPSRAAPDDPIAWWPVHPVLDHQEGMCAQGRFHLAHTEDGRVSARFKPHLPPGVSLLDVLTLIRCRTEWDAEAHRIAAWDPRGDGSGLGTYRDFATAREGLHAALSPALPDRSAGQILPEAGFRPYANAHRRVVSGQNHTLTITETQLRLTAGRGSKPGVVLAELLRPVYHYRSLAYGGSGHAVWPLGREGHAAQVQGLVELSLRLMPALHARAA